jgi:transcriptional regulator with XRE-family HTH domain
MESIEKRLGHRIAGQRRLAGLSQARLAEKIGVSPETISRLETGAAAPSIARLASIARALEVELQELFRLRPGDDPRELALRNLLWVVSRRTVQEIELVTNLAATVFDFHRRKGG